MVGGAGRAGLREEQGWMWLQDVCHVAFLLELCVRYLFQTSMDRANLFACKIFVETVVELVCVWKVSGNFVGVCTRLDDDDLEVDAQLLDELGMCLQCHIVVMIKYDTCHLTLREQTFTLQEKK